MSAFLRPRVENIFPTRGNFFSASIGYRNTEYSFIMSTYIVTEVTVTVLYKDRLVYQISDISFVLRRSSR